ncbi:MAG: 3-oxoacyl-[acyl-carrier-protein] reductase [Deltaproteobacteria bacterium]|nr:3-oxoacyl-[acyl-carrier-protein] reductase [Deltaproteobacteria bacterium]
MTAVPGRVILVTGGSRGIGRAVALAFSSPGDAVVVNYRNDRDAASETVAEIRRQGAEAESFQADVAEHEQVRSMIEAVVARFGRIDVLVNNAGGNRDGYLAMMSLDDWNSVIDVNLKGVFHCCKTVARIMMAERRGAIVNVSSLSGITGLPGQTNYAAAKGGVNAFTRALAQELAPFGIRVNAVAPGLVETDPVSSMPPEHREALLRNIPMRRMGTPEEVAAVVRFLASDDASYVTGEIIKVTGGI